MGVWGVEASGARAWVTGFRVVRGCGLRVGDKIKNSHGFRPVRAPH